MSKAIKDGIVFGLFGALMGAAIGVLGSSAFVTIKAGGKFEDVGVLDIFQIGRASCRERV